MSRSETNGSFLGFFGGEGFRSGIYFRCRLDNSRRFPNFQLPTIGVTADFYILHFLDNCRCSYTIHFVQTQFLLQMDLPLHIHTRSCKKSDVMCPSKYFGIKYLFSFLHPYSIGGLASLACVHTYTWNATRNMCYLNAPSDGGSLTREESF